MGQKLNGQAFDFDVGGMAIHADKFTAEITDNTAAAKKDGRPDGWLLGDVDGKGEITVDHVEFKKLNEAAKKAGSWQQMDVFDIVSHATIGKEEFKVELFGCKLTLSSLLDVDKGSTDKTPFVIPFIITSPDFVNIDGVPYAKKLQS